MEAVLRRFLATKFYQILPFLTKNVQRTGSNRAPNGGFLRPIYLNRVKSGGSCQAVTGAAWSQNRREQRGGARVPRIEPGRGDISCLELFRAQPPFKE